MALEMERKVTEFVVEANGSCFFCAKSLSPAPPDCQEPISPNGGFPVSSLQVLSRYLGIDRRKLFPDERFIKSQLLALVEKFKLKAELCEECTSINNNISQMCQQLTKLEMGIAYELRRILEKLVEVRKSSQAGAAFPEDGLESDIVNKEKIQIVEALRKDAEQKCSRKIINLTQSPRVLAENLARKKASKQTPKFTFKEPPPADSLGEPDTQSESTFEATPHTKMRTDNVPEPQPSIISSIQGGDWTGDREPPEFDDCPASDEDFPAIQEKISNATLVNGGPRKATIPRSSKAPKSHGNNSNGLRGKGGNKTGGSKVNFHTTRNIVWPRKWRIDPKTGKRKCNDCHKQFSSQTGFRSHYQTVHLKLRYKCVACKKLFSTKGSLRVHQRTSQSCSVKKSAPKFKCHLCEKSFSLKHNRKEHLEGVHYKLQKYACNLCEKKFNIKRNLASHRRNVHRMGKTNGK